MKVSVEAYHTWNVLGEDRTYPRFGVGWFFQTKPSGD
jgi:hypothetical protein